MKVLVYSAKKYDKDSFDKINQTLGFGHEIQYLETHLNHQTVALADGFRGVCCFVNDPLDAQTLGALKIRGVEIVALRCAGFNQVDLAAAKKIGVSVVRVPAYSPHAVAEHTLALMLTLNRKTHKAYHRVREANFSLEGLTGFDMFGKTTGVIGTGKIGAVMCGILQGLGCKVLAYDPNPNEDLKKSGVTYADLPTLFKTSDIVTLHCPLTPQTRHIIDAAAIALMKPGVMIVNTGRGALIDSQALIPALKNGKIGHLGLDVYEEEADLFFEDLSTQIIQDDLFARLCTFPNVLITGHQAFLTHEALENIAQTTLSNLSAFEKGTLNSSLLL